MKQFSMNLPTLKEIEVNFFRKLQEQFSEGLVRYLEQLDEWIMEQRDRSRFRLHDLRELSLGTMFGEITFKRRVYRDREKNQFVYLLDQALSFDGESMVSPHLEEMAIELASQGPSYRESAKKIEAFLGYPAISHEAIRNKLIERAKQPIPASETKRKANVLFVEVDGLYAHLQRQKKRGVENQIAVVHEGWEKNGERVRLLHKRHYLHQGKEPFWEGFMDFLTDHYDIDEQTWLVVNGDGAEWIGECRSYFHRCVYNLDRFHVFKELRRYLRELPSQWKLAREALEAYDPKALLNVVDEIPMESIREEWQEDWKKYKAFLRRHQEHLKDYREKLREAGVDTSDMQSMGSAESQMSVMAKRTKGGYSWSMQGVSAMLLSIMARKEGRTLGGEVTYDTNTKTDETSFRMNQLFKKSKEAVKGYTDGMIRYLHTSAQSTPLGATLKGLRL